MFVRKSTYEREKRRRISAQNDFNELQSKYWSLYHLYENLRVKAARLEMLASTPKTPDFDKTTINKLLSLCHPDKHGGKKTAEEMTAKLLKLRQGA